MTARQKAKDSWLMDGILQASALEQMVPRGQPVCSMDEQVKFGKLSQLWKNLLPHSYTHTHTHTHTHYGASSVLEVCSSLFSSYQVLLFA